MKASRVAVIAIRFAVIGAIAAAVVPMLSLALLDAHSARNGPSHFLTTTEMSLIDCKRAIQCYALQHNALPSHELNDCWGHPVSISVDSDGMVTLTSLGRDNKPGGTGSDADMIGRYPSRQPDGRWSDESVDWTKDPYPPELPDARKPETRAAAATR
jgi:hypothetical protein